MATDVEVLVIGFGPGGEVATSLLAQAGHRVLAIDKAAAPYGEPRMSQLDGEIARVLQHAADPKEAMAEAIASKVLLQFDSQDQPLPEISLDYRVSGNWRAYNLHQPHIEQAMERRVTQCPSAEFRWGWRAIRIAQDDDGVTAEIASVADPAQTETVRARYLLGFDGASSFVRGAVGIDLDVLHEHDDRWILTDFNALRPLPAIAMTAQFRMDPKRPWFGGSNGLNRCRTDMRVMPGEDLDAMVADRDQGYAFMEEKFGLTREDIVMTRRVGYRFRSQIARRFRAGRVFIGGDAAHAMPPFMGQGACSAMRDAINIAWKLRLVLSGATDESLLDSYEPERLPHASFFVHGSLAMLRAVNITDPAEAAARDAAVRAGNVKFPPFPGLVTGVVRRAPDGGLAPLAGSLAPQGVVGQGGREALVDDLIGFGGQLVSRLPLAGMLGEERMARLADLGIHVLHIGDAEAADLADVEGTYRAFFEETGASAFLARADFYLFGIATGDSDVPALVDDFLRQLPPPDAPAAASERRAA